MKKLAIVLFTVLCTSLLSLSAQTFNPNGFQQFKIGNIEAIILSDGYINISPVQPFMAPEIDPVLVAEQLGKHYQSEKGIQLSMNILLMKVDDHFVLFDTGEGKEMTSAGGALVDNLQLIGITPDKITDIIITHAHLDHIGGLINAEGKSIYPNATIYISRIEHEFWTKGKPDLSKSKIKDEAMLQMVFQGVNSILSVIKPQLQLIEDKETILDCVKIEIMPGHTIGHFVSTISSNGESIFHMADIVHAEALLFAYPEWGNAFDSDFDLGIKNRIKVLRQLNETDPLVFGYHLPYPGLGHVRKIAGDSYRWIPSSFSTPQLK